MEDIFSGEDIFREGTFRGFQSILIGRLSQRSSSENICQKSVLQNSKIELLIREFC